MLTQRSNILIEWPGTSQVSSILHIIHTVAFAKLSYEPVERAYWISLSNFEHFEIMIIYQAYFWKFSSTLDPDLHTTIAGNLVCEIGVLTDLILMVTGEFHHCLINSECAKVMKHLKLP